MKVRVNIAYNFPIGKSDQTRVFSDTWDNGPLIFGA